MEWKKGDCYKQTMYKSNPNFQVSIILVIINIIHVTLLQVSEVAGTSLK